MNEGVLANLDVEARLGGQTLPESLQRRLSAAGSLLRVLARPREGLWTPRELDVSRVPELAGLPSPTYLSGEGQRLLQPRIRWADERGSNARIFSRRFDLECMQVMQSASLEGIRWVHDVDELYAALSQRGCSEEFPWVLKSEWSSAGRGALHGRGTALRDGTAVDESPAVRAMLAAPGGEAGGALLEPWLPRLLDVGCRGVVEQGGVRLEGGHRLHVTSTGGFRGVDVMLGHEPLPELSTAEWEELQLVSTRVGGQLAQAGYLGPFSVDAFAYRKPDGKRAFRSLCEVNPRWTFGFVARAWAVWAAQTHGWAAETRVGFRFGKVALPEEAEVPLLLPASVPVEGGDTCAWLQRVS